jgi:hypothetical protein
MRRQTPTAERRIAAIASRQKGNVTRAQLLGAGLSESAIERRLRKGLLFVEYPGVYRVGHRAPSDEARYLAAVLACGEGAVLCGLAAAHTLDLVRSRPPEPKVLVPGKRRIAGVRTHRTRRIEAADYWIFNGIPMTTVARTVVDLAAALPREPLGRAFHQARVRYGTTVEDVEQVLRRRPNSLRAATLRRALRGDDIVLSKLEECFLELLEREGLPLPQSRHAWEQDHRRERLVRAAGFEFRRFTHDDVIAAPALMLRELRALLA